jgi:predicted DNA binding CopG/RHH family protein
MLLKDFIGESRNESKELNLLARRILQTYQKEPRRTIELKGLMFADEPQVQNLLDTVKVKFDSKYDRSLYNPRTKEVLIKLGDQDLTSELIHELQHALDDLKSQGKFRNEPGDYQTRQSEVNARLAQAVADIESALGKARIKGIDWQNLKMRSAVERLIASYLKKHQLTPQHGIDNKRYQRLLKRIYGYILEL